MRRELDLETPWLRVELVERLTRLADPQWLASVTNSGGTSGTLDETLDFFDDTGVLEEPSDRIGYMLLDQLEADAMYALGSALQKALEESAHRDWRPVAHASRDAIQLLQRYE